MNLQSLGDSYMFRVHEVKHRTFPLGILFRHTNAIWIYIKGTYNKCLVRGKRAIIKWVFGVVSCKTAQRIVSRSLFFVHQGVVLHSQWQYDGYVYSPSYWGGS